MNVAACLQPSRGGEFYMSGGTITDNAARYGGGVYVEGGRNTSAAGEIGLSGYAAIGEKDMLVNLGWKYEGIGWYSANTNGAPLYRQYNPNAQAGSHNYTLSKSENDTLVALGWQAEGIGWYGVK